MAAHTPLISCPRSFNLLALSSLLRKSSLPHPPSFRPLLSPRPVHSLSPPFFRVPRASFLSTNHRFRLRCMTTIAAQTDSVIAVKSDPQTPPVIPAASAPTFQQAIQRLQDYWASMGCAVMQSSNTEVGAGTMNPATFLRVLGPEPWNVAYVEPSIRPDDSRYGDNPNRLQRHTQFQVILKPDPGNSQELYLGSLAALGVDIKAHDVRFVEDNWESPVLGAWGLGWEVWMDGMEITQFTYFQQAGSLPLMPVSVEITYGLERILMAIQAVDHFKRIQYASGITYGELFLENEKEMSAFYLDCASVEMIQQQFDLYDTEARALLNRGLVIPAYDYVLKTSHAFNILDARGAVGVTERARFFGRMRKLARECAQLWVKTRETLNHPLGVWKMSNSTELPPEAVVKAAAQVTTPCSFVLEIGTEELPSQDVISATDQLEEAFQQFLKKRRLRYGTASCFGTPRRLVIFIENLSQMQDDLENDVRGPPWNKAFDDKGEPTKALDGFCKKNGIAKDQIVVRTDGKIEYVYATVKEQGKHAIEVLVEDLPGIIKGISFPRTMRWNSQVSFSRPIRWLLALHGDTIVPFCYADILSGRSTRTLRNSLTPSIQIERAEHYMECMKLAGITLNMQERRRMIWMESCALASHIGGRLPKEAYVGLLDEIANLVEDPTPLLCRFDKLFLELPPAVLTTVMRKHQRYFPVEDPANGHLLPAFVAVANGKIDAAVVQKGNEAVLRARCEDAKFFYELDISKPLAEFRPQLSGILFQEKLGSMLDKNNRIESMIFDLGTLMCLDEKSIATAQKAASLAYADLATATVTEFTSLAGIMGKHYAAREGQPVAVAHAIFESVLPRHAGDTIPHTLPGILLAIADRLDSLVGLFAVGCQPTSTADPFGLRRSAHGLINIIVENKNSLDMNKALHIAASVQPLDVSAATLDEVQMFITRRFEQLLIDRGANVEFVRAILLECGNNPTLATQSIEQLEELAKEDAMRKVVMAYSRLTKIARPELLDLTWKVNEDLFQQPEEKALWNAYKHAASLMAPGINMDAFLEASLGLVQPLNEFFDAVFVLVEDRNLQKNRISLLQKIAELPKGIIDLSVLPGF